MPAPAPAPSPAAAVFVHEASRPAAQFFRLQPWFAHLPPAMADALVERSSLVRGAKGAVLLHAGEAVQGWYAVLAGLVSLQSQAADGRRQGFLGIPAGEWFGEGSVMKDEPRRYDAIALRDTDLLCLPRALFDELRETSIPFNRYLADHLNLRLGQAMTIIETMRLRTPEQRVAMYLGPRLWRGSRKMGLSQEELGILAGLSRQTVNRVLNDLERRGLVQLEFGRIGIRDEAGLAALVREG
jgi:CRP-like cAMP-binding protein